MSYIFKHKYKSLNKTFRTSKCLLVVRWQQTFLVKHLRILVYNRILFPVFISTIHSTNTEWKTNGHAKMWTPGLINAPDHYMDQAQHMRNVKMECVQQTGVSEPQESGGKKKKRCAFRETPRKRRLPTVNDLKWHFIMHQQRKSR
jgi:hypothetical protein